MAGLTHHQKRVLFHVIDVGVREKHASRNQLLSAIITDLTEGRDNPKGGEGSSSGWRQQIAGAGAKSRNRQNVRQQARYYYDEAKGAHGSPGDISNAVQRSAFPGRPHDPALLKQAEQLLAAYHRGHLGAVRGTPGTAAHTTKYGVRPPSFRAGKTTVDYDQALVDSLLSSARGHRHSGLLKDVGRRLDSGAYTTTTRDKYTPAKYKLVRTAGTKGTPGAQGRLKAGSGPGHGHGGVSGRPLDRAGVRTNQHVIDLVARAGKWAGLTIALGTGSQHKRITSSGNVSDHWSGGAIDLPATGAQGDHIAGALLAQLGLSRSQARKLAQQGGIHNIHYKGHRYQVIWKAPDHYDHVHIGRR